MASSSDCQGSGTYTVIIAGGQAGLIVLLQRGNLFITPLLLLLIARQRTRALSIS